MEKEGAKLTSLVQKKQKREKDRVSAEVAKTHVEQEMFYSLNLPV